MDLNRSAYENVRNIYNLRSALDMSNTAKFLIVEMDTPTSQLFLIATRTSCCTEGSDFFRQDFC